MFARRPAAAPTRVAMAVAVGLFALGLHDVRGAHQPIASRWTYNEDIYPLFAEHCGSCHVQGGSAPFSLLTYRDAYPWSQAIREEVSSLQMPPWRAEDGFGHFRNGTAMPAAAMDKILEWASGGYPEGPRDQAPPPAVAADAWPLGPPDLTAEVPVAFALDADTSRAVRYFPVATGLDEDRWVRGLDVTPGVRAVVRSVAVYVDAAGLGRDLDAADPEPGFAPSAAFPTSAPLVVWAPDQRPVYFGDEAGYRLPTGADLVLRVDYRKTWVTEGTAFADQSRVGVYFADGAVASIDSLVVTAEASELGSNVATRAIDHALRVVSILPEVGVPASDLRVEAVLPDGRRRPMLLLREPDPAWPARFWFDGPVDLPEGSELQVTVTRRGGAYEDDAGSLLPASPAGAVRLAVDYY